MAKLKEITFMIPYYDNPKMLAIQLNLWNGFSKQLKERVKFLLIDDGSTENFAMDIVNTVKPKIQLVLYRIEEDIPWNWSGVRNLCFTVADTEWVLHTDICNLLEEEQWWKIFDEDLYENCFYRLNRLLFKDTGMQQINPHTDTFLIAKDLFWKAKGYDEDYAGWYGKATFVFKKQLLKKGARERLINATIHRIDTSLVEDAKTRNYGRKGSEYDIVYNPTLMKKSKSAVYKPENYLRFTWFKQLEYQL